MEKIKFRNRFRVLTPNGHKIRLNSTLNSNGIYQFVEGFDSYKEAQEARMLYCSAMGVDPSTYKIQTYSETVAHTVEQVSEAANKLIVQMRLFSGRGLKYNTDTPKHEENKYQPHKYYGREVYMYQSTERNKGISLIHNKKDKAKGSAIQDMHTFERLNSLSDHGAFSFTHDIVASLKRKSFANRKAVKDYLRQRGFTWRQVDTIITKLHA